VDIQRSREKLDAKDAELKHARDKKIKLESVQRVAAGLGFYGGFDTPEHLLTSFHTAVRL
jgi:hypothetical protein